MTQFENKTAFVTGAASGIGLAIAGAFAAAGSRVMMTDINADGLKICAQDLQGKFGDHIKYMAVDTAQAASVDAARDAAITAFGPVHYLINNAGVSLAGKPGHIPLADWRWIVDINLMGLVHGVESFVPHMAAHGEGGHVVNTASMAGHMATAGMAPYHATKFAAVGYSEGLYHELKPLGIGVSVLCPTWVKSNIHNTSDMRPTAKTSRKNEAKTSPFYEQIKALIENGMPPDRLAELVLKSIAAKRLYIFNDPDAREAINIRRELILKDYDACLEDLGLEDLGLT